MPAVNSGASAPEARKIPFGALLYQSATSACHPGVPLQVWSNSVCAKPSPSLHFFPPFVRSFFSILLCNLLESDPQFLCYILMRILFLIALSQTNYSSNPSLNSLPLSLETPLSSRLSNHSLLPTRTKNVCFQVCYVSPGNFFCEKNGNNKGSGQVITRRP